MYVQKPDRGLNLQSIKRRRRRWLSHSEGRTLTITLGGEHAYYYTRRRGRWLLHSEATTLPMLIIVFRVQSQCNYIFAFHSWWKEILFQVLPSSVKAKQVAIELHYIWHAWTKWLQTIKVWFEILHFHNKIKFMKPNKIYDAKQSVLPIFLVFFVVFFACFVCLRPGSCVKCCQCLWIVHYWLPIWFPPNVYVYR